MEPKGGRHLDAQRRASSYHAALPVVFPNLQATAALACAQVTLSHCWNHVKNFAVGGGTQQLDVFSMGPHQGHGSSGGLPKIHVAFGHIVCVPHLFWQQSCRGGKCLDGLQKGSGAAAGG